jgi:hypothetical protein
MNGVSGSDAHVIELGWDRDGTEGAREGLLVDARKAQRESVEQRARAATTSALPAIARSAVTIDVAVSRIPAMSARRRCERIGALEGVGATRGSPVG